MMGLEEQNHVILLWFELIILICFTPTMIGVNIMVTHLPIIYPSLQSQYFWDRTDVCGWRIASILVTFYFIRQGLVLVLHYGVKKRKRYCVIFWLTYYAFETIGVTFTALVFTKIYPFDEFMTEDRQVMTCLTVMIFADIGAHVLSFVVIGDFIKTLNRKRRMVGGLPKGSTSTIYHTAHEEDQEGMLGLQI